MYSYGMRVRGWVFASVILHMGGYSRCYDILTHVRRHAFINQVPLFNRRPQLEKNAMIGPPFAATFPGNGNSMSAGRCRSTYILDTINGAQKIMIEAFLLEKIFGVLKRRVKCVH